MNGDMIQIHMLTAYPAALLNRDDAGLAKRVPFGGHTRIRVSSQCLKKHWREAPAFAALGEQADRSTRIYEERIARPLREEHGATQEEAEAIARYLMLHTVNTTETGDDHGRVISGQLLVLSRAETRFLADLGKQVLDAVREANGDATQREDLEAAFPLTGRGNEFRSILKALPASIDTALFGRMVTSDLFARVDAAVSVAHALTTHAEEAEIDYFTAVDTLKTLDEDAGAGLIQETELTSGVFYLYSVVDMNQLRENLGAAADSADDMVRALIQTMATVSPGAKRGSTAPYAYAEFVLLERGDEQPRSLAGAFLDPVRAKGGSLMRNSIEALLDHRARLAHMYDGAPDRLGASSIHPIDDPSPAPLAEAIEAIL